jgi:drug/metabolite transporter (DMT)-like permease
MYFLLGGLGISLDLSAWVVSLFFTSLANSMLFLSSGPLLMVAWGILRCQPPNWKIILSTVVGLGGMLMIVFGAESGTENTSYIIGDFIALGGALGFVLYFRGSTMLAKVYDSPLVFNTIGINIVGLVLSFTYSVGIYHGSYAEVGDWINMENLWPALYLGLIPGFIGHLIANFTVRHLNPITIVTIFNLEAFFGTVIGILFGVQIVPGWLVWVGGVVLILSASMISILDINEVKIDGNVTLGIGTSYIDASAQ